MLWPPFWPTGATLVKALPWRGLLVFGTPFIIYAGTLAPTVFSLDSAELTTAAATLGLMRATGYPLYLLLGHLWSWLPIGDVGFRLNLFSAFCGALTIALTERILARLGVGAWGRGGALGLLAFSYPFWTLSLVAEIYTLHTVFLTALILALMQWQAAPTPQNLGVMGLLYGLSCTHHGATVLLLPGLACGVWLAHGRAALRPRALLWAGGGLVAGLLPYLYLPWRYAARPAFNYAGQLDAAGVFIPINLQTWAGVWEIVSGQAFRPLAVPLPPLGWWAETTNFLRRLWAVALGVGLGPGLLGLWWLLRRPWAVGTALALMFVGHTLFFINYRAVDKATMFLPSYVIWALWMGVGFQRLFHWLQPERPLAAPWPQWVLRGLIGVMVVGVFLRNLPNANLSNAWQARTQAEAILQQMPPNAIVIGGWGTIPVVQYLQLVEGQRPDVRLISRFLISPDNLRQFIRAEQAHARPIYIDYLTADLEWDNEVEIAGPIYRLVPPAPP